MVQALTCSLDHFLYWRSEPKLETRQDPMTGELWVWSLSLLLERRGEERRGEERTGQDRTGQDRTGQERRGEERRG